MPESKPTGLTREYCVASFLSLLDRARRDNVRFGTIELTALIQDGEIKMIDKVIREKDKGGA
jgi:ribosomal protein L7Ae-like RNA K-turn-binding protein